MANKQLSKSEIRKLNEKLGYLGTKIEKKSKVERLDDNIIMVDDKPSFFIHDERILPTLKFLLQNQLLPGIIVDMGAVKFVVNGADIMRPGIVEIDEHKKDDIVCIMDVNNKKPLAVGISLYDKQDMQELDKGKAILNIHHVGDEIWSL